LLSKFYRQKLFESSLLCCCIFTLVLVGTLQCVNLFYYELLCVTRHFIKQNQKEKNLFRPVALLFCQTAIFWNFFRP